MADLNEKLRSILPSTEELTYDDYPELDIARTPEEEEEDRKRWNNRRHFDTWVEFPVFALSDIARAFVEAQAALMDTSPAPVALSLLATIGGTAGGLVTIKTGPGWDPQAGTLWTAIIGMSGEGKTPLMKSVISLTKSLDSELLEEHERKLKEWEIRESQRRKAKGRCGDGSDSEVISDPKPIRRKLKFTDATYEGLIKNAPANPYGMFYFCDELSGWFNETERNKTANNSWLSLYDGGDIQVTRATKSDIDAFGVRMAILGGCTPQQLRGLFTSNGRTENGCLPRFTLCWYPTVPETVKAVREDAVYKSNRTRPILEKIVRMLVKMEPAEPIRWDYEAQQAWNEWKSECRQKQHEAYEDMETSILAKGISLCARFAAILATFDAAEKAVMTNTPIEIPKRVGIDLFNRAKTLAEWCVNENRECYAKWGLTNQKQKQKKKAGRKESPQKQLYMEARDAGTSHKDAVSMYNIATQSGVRWKKEWEDTRKVP